MKIEHLMYLLEANKQKSFSKAAKSLFVSQSTISKAISTLEEEYNITIFIRGHGNLKLTYDGATFIEMASGLLEHFEGIKEYFTEPKDKRSLIITSIPSTFVSMSFYHLISKYNEEDNFYFEMNTSAEDNILKEVATGNSDLGVILLSEPHTERAMDTIADMDLFYQKIASSTISVILSQDNASSTGNNVKLNDLSGYTYVTLSPTRKDLAGEDYLDDYHLLDRLNFARKIVVSDRQLAYRIINSSKAFTFAFNGHRDYFQGLDLCCKKLSSPLIKQEIGIVYLEKHNLSETAMEFIKLVEYEFSNRGWLSDCL